ncbi:MAG: hypothetical protein HY049_03205 [Acidobacteria bacterium]|nr:hypothetical protein [Acidobacteriota bacterium]
MSAFAAVAAAVLAVTGGGLARSAESAGASPCADCHDVAPAIEKSVHGAAGLACTSCHADLAEVKDFPHAKPNPVDCTGCHEVPASAKHPPACADCHGSHGIARAAALPSARRGPMLSSMCGRCHEAIAREYGEGIHGQELAAGNSDVPTCLTCHGGHAIQMTQDPGSPVNSQAQAMTCASCHDDAEVARKYDIPAARMQTFRDSFHGLANAYGDRAVANCATCHGVHRILPSSDPRSTIAHDNLPATCGRCHEQAGKNFAVGKVHLGDRWEDNRVTYVARRFYLSAIGGMMSVFLVFMIADFRFRRRHRRERPGARP